MPKPVVLFTNDDGIESPGLFAAVEAYADTFEPLVVAPKRQQSGMGRAMPNTVDLRIYSEQRMIGGVERTIYAVDGSPAQAAQHGIIEIGPKVLSEKPVLVVSGINYGENVGNPVTISGTVGAALEAASLGFPAIAVSQGIPDHIHHTSYAPIDFSVAAYFTRLFGEMLLQGSLGPDVDILKIDVPLGATRQTPWQITRVSRHRFYWPTVERANFSDAPVLGFRPEIDPALAESDSDMKSVFADRVVSVAPMSLDMTSRIDRAALQATITSRLGVVEAVLDKSKISHNGHH